MIGYLSGKFLSAEDNSILVDVGGVGYSVLVPSRAAAGLTPGQSMQLHIHTNLRENALELFGFSSAWEKKLFLALTSVSGVGPRTAVAMLGGLDGETILSAIVREDRATLTSVSGIGKKTAERLIIELADKGRKLLAERPDSRSSHAGPATGSKTTGRTATKPAQAAAEDQTGLDIADLWNEALDALVNLGYREGDAIAAIKAASSKSTEAGESVSLENLIRSSLQLMSRGLTT